MITQTFKQGNNEIKIETMTSPEDAKKNNFKEGEVFKYYINGKQIHNYMSVIRFIIEESKNTNNHIIHNSQELINKRNELIQSGNNQLIDQIENIKKQYKNMPNMDISGLNNIVNKLNEYGVRVKR